MTQKSLTEILKKHGECNQSGSRFEIPDGSRGTVFASLGMDGLVIEPLRALVLEDDALLAITQKDERYVLLYEDVRALRFAKEPKAGVI